MDNLEIEIDVIENLRNDPFKESRVRELKKLAGEAFSNGGEIKLVRRFTNAPQEEVESISTFNEFEEWLRRNGLF